MLVFYDFQNCDIIFRRITSFEWSRGIKNILFWLSVCENVIYAGGHKIIYLSDNNFTL